MQADAEKIGHYIVILLLYSCCDMPTEKHYVNNILYIAASSTFG